MYLFRNQIKLTATLQSRETADKSVKLKFEKVGIQVENTCWSTRHVEGASFLRDLPVYHQSVCPAVEESFVWVAASENITGEKWSTRH